MLVLLDTNVILDALLSPEGAPARILQGWEAGEFNLATSPVLLAALERALTDEPVRTHLKLSAQWIESYIQNLGSATINVQPLITLNLMVKDPADNRVLECALAVKANYLVTGDDHLLELKEYAGALILPPAGFLELLAAGRKGK